MEHHEREAIIGFAAGYARSIDGHRYFPALKQQTTIAYEQQVGEQCSEAASAAIAAGILSVTAQCTAVEVPRQQAASFEASTS